MDRAHVCRHSDGGTAVPADQFGEQTYIKQGKGQGGLKGISTNEDQVSVWVNAHPVCTHLSKVVEEMYSMPNNIKSSEEDKERKQTKHKEEGERRRELDKNDRQKIAEEFEKHSHPLTWNEEEAEEDPLIETNLFPVNIVNGMVANDSVNAHNALSIGKGQSQSFDESLPMGFYSTIHKKVTTMEVLKKAATVKGKPIYAMESLFARLLNIGERRNIEMIDMFEFEMSPVPPSIIDEYGCLKTGEKSVLVKHLGAVLSNPPVPDVVFVDGGQLLYHLVWPVSGTVKDIATSAITRMTFAYTLFGVKQVCVVFDNYKNHQTAKDHTRLQRTGGETREYQLTMNTTLPCRKMLMKSTATKARLIDLLCSNDFSSKDISLIKPKDSVAQHEEADVNLIFFMLQSQQNGASVIRILSDDTDVFILLVYWVWKKNVQSQIQMERWDGSILNINSTVQFLGQKCEGLLAMHALSGCDSTSYPFKKGKISAYKVLNENNIPGLSDVLGEVNANEAECMNTGRTFFLTLYGQKGAKTMTNARYRIYNRSKKPPQLKELPPIDENLQLHIKRAHLQVMLWKAADKTLPPPQTNDITQFGWQIDADRRVMPILSSKSVAHNLLLDVISCNCASQKACSRKNCSCHASNLSCTSYCRCEGGDTCCNPFTGEETIEDQDEQSQFEEEVDK